MKVLIITNYLGNLGGLGRYSSEVVKALGNFPVDMVVVTEAPKPSHIFEQNLLKPVFNKSKITTVKNFISNTFAVRRLAKDCDVVHAHDGWPYGVYGWFATFGTNKKLFITGIGTYTIAPLREKIKGYFLRLAYRKSKSIFCISDFVLNRLLMLLPGVRAKTVFMGTTKLPQISSIKSERIKEEYNLTTQRPIILTVGDIKHRKGQLDTLKSLQLIKSKYPNFLYVMVGDDADKYYLQEIKSYAKKENLEKNILIISQMYDDEVLSFFYSACDLFALNSNSENDHFEGFGLVLLEAAQFGKPVVGSSDCGIESALSNGKNGYLTRQGDHEDISKKITDILENHKEEFGKNSLDFFQRFSWNKTVETYYKSYVGK